MASKTRTQRVRLSAAFGLLALTAVAALFLATALTASGSHPGKIARASGGAFSNRAAKAVQFPIYFEKNQGQVNRQARFLARTGGNSLFLTDNAAVFTLIGGGPAPH